jgi:hypothetical protein
MNAIAMCRKSSAVLAAAAVVVLWGCSTAPKSASDETDTKPQEAAGPAEPVPAKTAFWPMYTSARTWATDFVTLKLTAGDVPGFKNEAGKAAMWQATFASPSLKEYRVYSYSVAAAPPDIYKGVMIGRALPWGGATRDVMPIQLSEFSVDSDIAYQVAATDATAWLKKNPEQKLSSLQLVNAYKFPAPMWFSMWGNKKVGYIAFVNASTAKVFKEK